MAHIQLRIYTQPGEVETFCKLKFKDGTFERLTAIVDTGAATSLFPSWLLDDADHRLTERANITIDQVGIARQSFAATEAIITIVLKDWNGNLTQPFDLPAWFADTNQPLIGFAGVLDRSVLNIDMPQQQGWLDIDV